MSTPNSNFIPHPTHHLFCGAFEALALPGRHFANAGIACGSFFKHKHVSTAVWLLLRLLSPSSGWLFSTFSSSCFIYTFPSSVYSELVILISISRESISKIKEHLLLLTVCLLPIQECLLQLSCLLHHWFSDALHGSFHDMYTVPFLLS